MSDEPEDENAWVDDWLRDRLEPVREYVDQLCTPEYIERKLAEVLAAVAAERAKAAGARARRRPTYMHGTLTPWCLR